MTTAAGSEVAADRPLVARYLQDRDEDAFRALYREHAPYLWAFVLRLTGRREPEAEEVFQETWMAAARRLDAFRWDSAFRTWLTGIALNCWRRSVRRRPREPSGLPAALPSPGAFDPAEVLDLEGALASLSEKYRTVLLLYGVYGYTHAEIAERLGIAEGTSKSQLARGREALRRALANGRAREELR